MARDLIEAAGAVLVDDDGKVLLIHRPRYDDWSFPKGKRDRGEEVTACAVREVAEETGLTIRLGLPLSTQRYLVDGRDKEVRYWLGHPVTGQAGAFEPNDEVDEVRWLAWGDAERLLTHDHDRVTLREAARLTTVSAPLIVMRHSEAVSRGEFTGVDLERPLTPLGQRRSAAVASILEAYGVRHVVSSNAHRCTQSLDPFLQRVDARFEPTRALNEVDATAERVAAVVGAALTQQHPVVLCSHRPVLGWVFEALGVPDPALAAGAVVVVHHRGGAIITDELFLPE